MFWVRCLRASTQVVAVRRKADLVVPCSPEAADREVVASVVGWRGECRINRLCRVDRAASS